MYWKTLNKIDSSLYKGVAILMIVAHNFMHLFPKLVENEFFFKAESFKYFLQLATTQPESIIRISFAFFGHFGVQIFIFLSAYGLTKKYLLHKPDYWMFIWQRIIKIYPSFILAILAWLLVDGWFLRGDFDILGPLRTLQWSIGALLLKLSLLSNFIPGSAISPVGPWWFIPFIFQFYFTFPFLRSLFIRYGGWGLLSISVGSILFSMLTQGKIGNLNVYVTVLGHLPELCLGIYLANKDAKNIKIPKLIIISTLVIFVLGNIYETFWYANHISFLILFLAGFSVLVEHIKEASSIKRLFLYFNSISMPLFLVNGFLRSPFIDWAKDYDQWLVTIVLCLVSITFSSAVALVLAKTEDHIMLKVDATTPSTLFKQIKERAWVK